MTKEWDASRPLSDYAPSVQRKFREHAEYLLEDLKANKSEISYRRVQRDDINYDCKVVRRFVLDHSPPWYVEFWVKHKYSLRRKNNPDPKKKNDRSRGPKNSAIQR